MKPRTTALLFFTVSLAACLSAAACVPAPSGLVGWWKADGNTVDTIAGNNGVPRNVAYTSGRVGQAFAFDPQDYPFFTYTGVQIPDQPAFALTASLTVEAWIRPRGDGYVIFFRGDHRPGMDPYCLSMAGNNVLTFGITGEDGNSASVQVPLVYDQWWHVAATLEDTSGTLSLYTNGVLAVSTNTAVRPFGPLIPSESPGVGIGNVNDGGNVFPFRGDIDEVGLYNRALSPAEIQAIYQAGSAGKCPPSAPPCVPAPSGLVGWWKADGNTVDTIAGNNGVPRNVAYTSGIVGQAFAFDPQNYPFFTYTGVQIPDQPAFALTASLTIEAWIRPRGDGYVIFFRGDHRPGMDPYCLSMAGNNILTFGITGEDGNSASVQVPLVYDQWWHVAATLEDASGTLSLYTNGVLAVSTNTAVRPFGPLIPSESPGVGIGNVNDGGNVFPFRGDIDEVGLFNRALAPAEIQAIYQAGSGGKCPPSAPPCVPAPSGLVGWWKGDGNTVDTIAGNNGVPRNVAYASGIVGQAFAFDPQSYPYFTYTGVQIPDQPAFALTASLTIEAWIRPRGDGYVIFFRGDHRPGMDPYCLSMAGNNVLTFGITGEDGNSASVQVPLVYDQWWHVAATLEDASGTLSLYTNGVLAVSTNTAVRPFGPLIPSESPGVGIGNVNDGGNVFPFRGDIDEVGLYNRALSAAEIQAIYQAGSGGKCPPSAPPCVPAPSGLVGWWKADGNTVDTIAGNNGVPRNVAYTSGIVGQAFAFDPQNYPFFTYTGVQIPDQPAFALTASLTIEAWIRPRGDGYVIFFRGDHRPGMDPYCLSMAGNNNLSFGITGEDGSNASVQVPLVYDQWWHVAATLEDTSGTLSLYTNGVLAVSTNTAVRPFGSLIPSESPGVGIGNVNDGGNVFPFRGDIDEVGLYNRALSAAEIQAIYQAGSGGKCLPPSLPVPGNDSLGTPMETPVVLPATELLLNDFSPGGLPLSVTAVDASAVPGASVSLAGNQIAYTPPAGFKGVDTFLYTVSDNRGLSAEGRVTVRVGLAPQLALNLVGRPRLEHGSFTARFSGIPGLTYTMESAASTTGPWVKLTNITVPTVDNGLGLGVFEFQQPTGTNTTGFYRTVYPAY